jgi:hypothetical protein
MSCHIALLYLKFITFDISAGNKELANCAAKHKKSKIHRLRIKTMNFLMFPYPNSNPMACIKMYKNYNTIYQNHNIKTAEK